MEIVTEVADRVLRVEINRPEKKNALTVAMYSALAAALERGAKDATVRVILIHGHPQVFSSGNDLVDFMKDPPTTEDRPVFQFMKQMHGATKPIIAAVSGPAVGIGTTMLLHCDLVYAGESASFQLPFVNLALVPEFASSLLLPALAGYQRAAELLLLGEPFSATKAHEYGLVTEVTPDGMELETALVVAGKLAAQPPAALRLTKMLMKKGMAQAAAAQMREEGSYFGERLRSPEAMEAFKAFFEKRPPDFSKFS
jgi:enoyl-CoA hydratase/carnithine racemase